MSGKATHGSFFTVGLVSTPAPQHLTTSTTTTTSNTYTGTFTTTPLRHLASMSSGYNLPPSLSYTPSAATLAPTTVCPATPPPTNTTTPPPLTPPPSSLTPGLPLSSTSPYASSSAFSATRYAPPTSTTQYVPSASLATNSKVSFPSLSPTVNPSTLSSPPPFPRYGTGGNTFVSKLSSTSNTRPGANTNTNLTRSNLVTTITTHGPTVTTYTTYNPAINKFTTHTPNTTASTSFLKYRPFASYRSPTSATNGAATAANTNTTSVDSHYPHHYHHHTQQIYTLSPHLPDQSSEPSTSSTPPEIKSNYPPPPKVTLASTATALRPSPAWPLRVTLGQSDGYDNLNLDLGEDEGPPRSQVRTHMTKEQFLALPQPDLELLETGERARRGFPSGQERLEERRRGGVWGISLFPTSSSTTYTTTYTTTTLAGATTETQGNGVVTTTTATTTGAYCNQVSGEPEEEEGGGGGVWTVEGTDQSLQHHTSPLLQDTSNSPADGGRRSNNLTPPLSHPDASDSSFALHDVPLRGQ
ncbi:hypothetical protein Pcinc_031421 [Petrolisthes cinctipes]|uniref:Uncharacterized protein n=1 Tax=Petrolisthes cinctipes TaxID=88211 RepID=A0AAE1K2N0_PETCI|nr:hypothetical protein Pcinc_031421 [Petrolisthes cinctipes]